MPSRVGPGRRCPEQCAARPPEIYVHLGAYWFARGCLLVAVIVVVVVVVAAVVVVVAVVAATGRALLHLRTPRQPISLSFGALALADRLCKRARWSLFIFISAHSAGASRDCLFAFACATLSCSEWPAGRQVRCAHPDRSGATPRGRPIVWPDRKGASEKFVALHLTAGRRSLARTRSQTYAS